MVTILGHIQLLLHYIWDSGAMKEALARPPAGATPAFNCSTRAARLGDSRTIRSRSRVQPRGRGYRRGRSARSTGNRRTRSPHRTAPGLGSALQSCSHSGRGPAACKETCSPRSTSSGSRRAVLAPGRAGVPRGAKSSYKWVQGRATAP